MTDIFKLPESGEVSLSHDVVVDADDLQRFVDAGGMIYKRGYQVEVRGHEGTRFVEYVRRKNFVATKDAWGKTADHYRNLALARADEGTGVQLACLVLADYCAHRWLEDSGGPTLEMIMLAENTVGDHLDEVVTSAVTGVLRELTP